ncbi:MAG: M23 family metallopeptidase [Actinomycetota bacterium]
MENPRNQLLNQLINDYERGHLNEETLAKAIANRADQAGLNAADLAKEWMFAVLLLVVLGMGTVAQQQLQSPSASAPSSSEATPGATNINLAPGKFTRPTAAKAPIASKMGMRFHPVHKFWRLHAGIDIGVPTGTPVLAPADGVVTVAGWAGECGIKIQLEHGDGWDTRYCHNSQALVSVGQRVKQGQTIALSGNTGGYSTGPHLHFEVRKNGNPLDPLKFVDY